MYSFKIVKNNNSILHRKLSDCNGNTPCDYFGKKMTYITSQMMHDYCFIKWNSEYDKGIYPIECELIFNMIEDLKKFYEIFQVNGKLKERNSSRNI